MDSYRSGGCETPQLESGHDLSTPGRKRVDSICSQECISMGALRTLYSTNADGSSTSWDTDLFLDLER